MNKYKIFFLSFLISLFYFNLLIFVMNRSEKIFSSEAVFFYAEPIVNEFERLPNDFNINANAVISLKISKSGKETLIYSRNEDSLLPIASLTKLMTAIIVLDKKEVYKPFQVFSISKKAANQEGVSVLKEGENLNIENLLNISLIESSNDAAYALSEVISTEKFVGFMNDYAKEIGLLKTVFFNPTGLNGPFENLSTAKEISFLLKKIKEDYSEILDITKKKEYTVFTADGNFRHLSKNTNILLYEFPEIIGGKTGWTTNAKGCLVVLVNKPGENTYFINVILGADNRFEEMRKLLSIII